jgi:hypothetical protein
MAHHHNSVSAVLDSVNPGVSRSGGPSKHTLEKLAKEEEDHQHAYARDQEWKKHEFERSKDKQELRLGENSKLDTLERSLKHISHADRHFLYDLAVCMYF